MLADALPEDGVLGDPTLVDRSGHAAPAGKRQARGECGSWWVQGSGSAHASSIRPAEARRRVAGCDTYFSSCGGWQERRFPAGFLKGTSNKKLLTTIKGVAPKARVIVTAETVTQAKELYAAGRLRNLRLGLS